jgi:hypothetical protein
LINRLAMKPSRVAGREVVKTWSRGGAFVTIGAGLSDARGGGEVTNVSQAFQPSGRLALSNSP